MKDGKKHGVFWFFKTLLTIALVIYTCVRCCTIVSDKHHASALDTNVVTLTPAQTLALYGTQIQGLCYSTKGGSPFSITFDYAFPLSDIGYMDSGGGFDSTACLQATYLTLPERQIIADYFGGCNGLVYVASSSQWGSSDLYPYGYTAQGNVQLHFPVSVNVEGISGMKQGVCFSTTGNMLRSEWTVFYENTSTWIYHGLNNATVQAVQGQTQYSGVYRAAAFPLPTYAYYSNNPLDETSLQYFTPFYNSFQVSGEPFSFNGFTVDGYNVTNYSSGTDIWIIITCPTFYGYVPPVVTTTAPAETIPAATYPVATMPPDVTDVPANIINQNLVTNNYQLNVVIGQLNLIYAQLKANGEISARLAAALEADNDPGLQFPVNTDIRQYMSNAVYGSGTDFSYSPEDLQTYSRAIPWLASMFGGQTWFVPFAFLGSIGLIMIVLSYVVFRR